MNIRFELADHEERQGVKMIEVWDGKKFIAAMYPTAYGFRVVTRHKLVLVRALLHDMEVDIRV